MLALDDSHTGESYIRFLDIININDDEDPKEIMSNLSSNQ